MKLMCVGLFALAAVALGADFLASEWPLVAHVEGHTYWLPVLTQPMSERELCAGQGVVRTPVPFGPNQTVASTLEERSTPPPWAPDRVHWLGTDELGRDVLARVLHGTRVSLFIALLTVLISVGVGCTVGGLAGYFGGWVDLVASRVLEVMATFPLVFFLIALLSVLRTQSLWPLVVSLGLTRWAEVARLVRAEVLSLRSREFVLAARAMGASGAYIIRRHLIPNAMGPVVVSATFSVSGAILLESTLSFLGLGVAPPTASWGEMLTQAQRTLVAEPAWWLAVFPGAAILGTVMLVNALGRALERNFDVRR